MEFAGYDLEIEKALKAIEKEKAKKVLLQLPDGLKPSAKQIVDYLKEKSDAEFYIYMGSCYGACDFPQHAEKLGFDLLIAFGHSTWKY
jgi:2-(3-amino-3-carboxypropyl)histidine synthase